MKRIISLFIAVAATSVVVCTACGAGAAKKSGAEQADERVEQLSPTLRDAKPEEAVGILTLEQTSADIGRIKYKSEPRVVEFRFTNTGNAPLVITRSEVSCRCTTVKFPRKPVMPGESGVISVTYTPKNDVQRFNNSIRIYSNGRDKSLILLIHGEVYK